MASRVDYFSKKGLSNYMNVKLTYCTFYRSTYVPLPAAVQIEQMLRKVRLLYLYDYEDFSHYTIGKKITLNL